MLNQIFNEAIDRGDYLCANRCTESAQPSPNTMISSAERHSILLKTHTPQVEGRIRDQGVGGSNPLAPTILFKELSRTPGFSSTAL
jgi:hypothetical protein